MNSAETVKKEMAVSHQYKNENLSQSINSLKTLLEKQLQLIRDNKIEEFEQSVEQTGRIVSRIKQEGGGEFAELGQDGRDLSELYEKLILVTTARKELIDGQLRRLADGIKTVKTYLENAGSV